jgi:hypothetical protein
MVVVCNWLLYLNVASYTDHDSYFLLQVMNTTHSGFFIIIVIISYCHKLHEKWNPE